MSSSAAVKWGRPGDRAATSTPHARPELVNATNIDGPTSPPSAIASASARSS